MSKVHLAKEDAEDALRLNQKAPECIRLQSLVTLALHSQTSVATPEDFFHLGISYANGGNGKAKDRQQALFYLKVAAQTGHLVAEFELGKLLLEEGNTNAEALFHIQHSAEEGLAVAQFEIGLLLAFGEKCPRHELNAKKWLNKARIQGFFPLTESSALYLSDGKDWVEQVIKNARLLVAFESENNFYTTGMSIRQRQERYSSFADFIEEGIEELIKCTVNFASRIPPKSDSPMKTCKALWIAQMLER